MFQYLSQWHTQQKTAVLMGLLLFSYQSLFKDLNSIDYSALNLYLNITPQAALQTGEVLS